MSRQKRSYPKRSWLSHFKHPDQVVFFNYIYPYNSANYVVASRNMILTLQTTEIWLNNATGQRLRANPSQNTAGLWTCLQILSQSSVYRDTSSVYVTWYLDRENRKIILRVRGTNLSFVKSSRRKKGFKK